MGLDLGLGDGGWAKKKKKKIDGGSGNKQEFCINILGEGGRDGEYDSENDKKESLYEPLPCDVFDSRTY